MSASGQLCGWLCDLIVSPLVCDTQINLTRASGKGLGLEISGAPGEPNTVTQVYPETPAAGELTTVPGHSQESLCLWPVFGCG